MVGKKPSTLLCPQERVFDSDGNFLREEWEDYDGDSTAVFGVPAGSRSERHKIFVLRVPKTTAVAVGEG